MLIDRKEAPARLLIAAEDKRSGSLRSALDAALSSPSGQGMAVDGDGAVAGSISADDVLRALEGARRDEAAA